VIAIVVAVFVLAVTVVAVALLVSRHVGGGAEDKRRAGYGGEEKSNRFSCIVHKDAFMFR
jgi:hypothetical protein